MTKEAAREEAWIRYLKTNPTIATDKWAFVQGFDAGYESARDQWTVVENGLPTRDDWYPVRVDDGVNPAFQTCAYFNGEEFEVYQVVAWFDVPPYQQGGE